jgi:hypothetical protein
LNKEKRGFFSKIDGKTKDLLLVFALLFALVVSAWQIFQKEDTQETALVNATETEIKVMRLLEEIDGVGEANVIVCETEEGSKNVVVVCEGANDLRVVMNIRSAVAAALGTEEKAVKVYLKKE